MHRERDSFCVTIDNSISKSAPLPALRNLKRHFIHNAHGFLIPDLLIRQIIGSKWAVKRCCVRDIAPCRECRKCREQCRERGANDEEIGTNSGVNDKNGADNVVNDKNGANKNGSISPTDNLTEKELRIYQLVKENPEITTNGIADEMQVSIRTTQRYISVLRDKGFIVKAGNREQVKWIILK